MGCIELVITIGKGMKRLNVPTRQFVQILKVKHIVQSLLPFEQFGAELRDAFEIDDDRALTDQSH